MAEFNTNQMDIIFFTTKIRKYIFLILVVVLFSSSNFEVHVENTEQKNKAELSDSLIFIFSGDIMGHSPQFQAAYNPNTKKYNYNICFKNVKKYIEKADFAVANLEVPVAGVPYSGYPNFSSPDALLDGLKYSGYNILLTANNHVLDRGKFGLERTIKQIKSKGFNYLGSYLDKNQRDSIYPLILESKGVKIAMLNCTYGTNAGVVTSPNIVNYINTTEILKDIEKADREGVDFKIMTIHWGTEYELHSNEFQRTLAQFFVDHGINLIVGSHPHVVQNAEILYSKDSVGVPVFYSLGNSISNQRKLHTNGGIMLQVVLDVKQKSIRNTAYMSVYVHKGLLNGIKQFHLIPTNKFIAGPELYKLNSVDSLSLVQFDIETRKRLSNVNQFYN